MVDPYKAIWATLVYITVPFLMATMLITEALDIFFHLITFGALRYAPPTQPLHEKACQVSVSESPFQEVCSKKSTQVENNFVYKTPTRKSVQSFVTNSSVHNFVGDSDVIKSAWIIRPKPQISPVTRKRKRSPQTLPTIYESDGDSVSQITRARSLSLFTSSAPSNRPSTSKQPLFSGTRQLEFPMPKEEGGAFYQPLNLIAGSCSVVGDGEEAETGYIEHANFNSIQVTSNAQKRLKRNRGYTI